MRGLWALVRRLVRRATDSDGRPSADPEVEDRSTWAEQWETDTESWRRWAENATRSAPLVVGEPDTVEVKPATEEAVVEVEAGDEEVGAQRPVIPLRPACPVPQLEDPDHPFGICVYPESMPLRRPKRWPWQ